MTIKTAGKWMWEEPDEPATFKGKGKWMTAEEVAAETKPTTGEWTAVSLESEREHIGWQALAEVINAALAVERKRGDEALDWARNIQQELTAEQAKREDWEKGYGRLCDKAAVLVDALKEISERGGSVTGTIAKAALAKISPQDEPVQLPMINDDPVVTLK